jgi:hypothetical protein
MHKPTIGLLCVFLCAASAGCSGGGGDSSSTSPDLAEITSTNAKSIASAVMASSLETEKLGAFTPTAAAGTSGAWKPTAALYTKVGSVEDAQTSSLLKQNQEGYMQAAVGPDTSNCEVSGTVTVSGDLKDLTSLSLGDSITVSFADCDDGTTVADGTLTMQVTSMTGDFASGMFSLGVDVTLTDFRVTTDGETVTADGDISLLTDTTQSPTISLSISSSSLTIAGANGSYTLSGYSLAAVVDAVSGEFSREASGTLTSTVFDGSVTFETQVDLHGTGAGYAASGELLITGAGGATIHLIVLDSTTVRLELDLDGDGETDEVIDASWAELT